MPSKTQRAMNARREPGERPATPRTGGRLHRHRLKFLVGGLAALLTVGLLSLSLFLTLRSVRQDLSLGRSAMERGRSELGAGDAEAAAASFREGRQLFERAEDGTSSLIFGAMGWLPILGRTGDAVDAVAESAVIAADAAIVLADAAAGIPGGLSGLAPTGGAFPIERIPTLARAAIEADELMTDALSRLQSAPSSLLLGPVGPARLDAEEELGDLRETFHAASLLLQGLPTFLGADGPQRYFFGAQNPAELRGTGGLIGAYSILRIDEGRFRFAPFVPIHLLGHPPLSTIPPPNEDYAENYDQFRRAGWFWTSINVMPDLPSVGQAILSSYEAATDERLDGVILTDPFALAALLEVTGPVELRGYNRIQIDAGNVVDFTTNEAYSLFTDSTLRKRVLGDVARAAFERFVERRSADPADLRQLLEAASQGHIRVFSNDPSVQEGLEATPAAGGLRPAGADGDLLSVVVNSAAGSKVDFYEERDIGYSIELGEDGSGTAALDLTLRNTAPTTGQPPYVIGPFHPTVENIGTILPTLEAGESVALVNVYCGSDCIPGEVRLGPEPFAGAFRADLGVRYFQRYFSIKSGEEEALRVSWEDPEAWEGNSSGGVYRMTFTNQVTIRPATLSLRIEPPSGMEIASVTSPLEIVDGAAVYEGRPGSRLDVVVEFRPPVPVRLWRNVTRFLTTPVFEF